MGLQRQITSLLTKWKAIPIQTLVNEINSDRYKLISNTITRLRDYGLLEIERFSRYGRYKYIRPTQKLLDETSMNDTFKVDKYWSEEDALVSYLCIKLESYPNVNETIIKSYLLGTRFFDTQGVHYPSALMKLRGAEGIYNIPIEFRIGLNRISAIKDKFEDFNSQKTRSSTGSYYLSYSLIIFIVATIIMEIIDYIDKASSKMEEQTR